MLIVKVLGFTILYRIIFELVAFFLRKRSEKRILDEKTRSFLSIVGALLTSLA
jgi:hypothetical protein